MREKVNSNWNILRKKGYKYVGEIIAFFKMSKKNLCRNYLYHAVILSILFKKNSV